MSSSFTFEMKPDRNLFSVDGLADAGFSQRQVFDVGMVPCANPKPYEAKRIPGRTSSSSTHADTYLLSLGLGLVTKVSLVGFARRPVAGFKDELVEKRTGQIVRQPGTGLFDIALERGQFGLAHRLLRPRGSLGRAVVELRVAASPPVARSAATDGLSGTMVAPAIS